MTDDKHVTRYVRITNRERFLIVRGLSILADACDTLGLACDEYGRTTPRMKELAELRYVFCEENWRKDCYIHHRNKVVSVETMEPIVRPPDGVTKEYSIYFIRRNARSNTTTQRS